MYRIDLSADQAKELEQTFKTSIERRLRDRCQAVLMVARGRRRCEVAHDLGVHRTTLRKWLQGYREHGLAGLRIPDHRCGRRGKPDASPMS